MLWKGSMLNWDVGSTENIVTALLLRFYFPDWSIGSTRREMMFFSSSSDFIPWSRFVVEIVYMLCCSIHVPPFMKLNFIAVSRRDCYWGLSWAISVYFTPRPSLTYYCRPSIPCSPKFYLLFWNYYWLSYACRMPFLRAACTFCHILHMFRLIKLHQE